MSASSSSKPKYKIGDYYNPEYVEEGDKVHDIIHLKNYYLESCGKYAREPMACFVKTEDGRPNDVSYTSLRKGWITQEKRNAIKKEERNKREADEKRSKDEENARIREAEEIIQQGNYYTWAHLHNFPEDTAGKRNFYFKDQNGRLMGLFFLSRNDYTKNIFVYNVAKNLGESIQINNYYNGPLTTYQYYYKSNNTSSSSSSSSSSSRQQQPNSSSQNSNAVKKCKIILEENKIHSKKDFFSWAAEGGHPNKGGNTSKFQVISDCIDKVYKNTGGKRKTRKHKQSRKYK